MQQGVSLSSVADELRLARQNLLRIAQGPLIATIFALKSRFGWVETTPPPREPPFGKKEAAARRAAEIASLRTDRQLRVESCQCRGHQ
jgi:hypothetical protein